jgi:hypothetical protein
MNCETRSRISFFLPRKSDQRASKIISKYPKTQDSSAKSKKHAVQYLVEQKCLAHMYICTYAHMYVHSWFFCRHLAVSTSTTKMAWDNQIWLLFYARSQTTYQHICSWYTSRCRC